MSETSGVGGGSPLGEIKKLESGPEGQKVENVLHQKVSTLGELKQLLVSQLGQQEGEKLYNSFLTSFAMMMLEQVQQSAERAKRAAQQARTGPAP